MAELTVLLEGRVAGRATFHDNRLSFSYDDAWRDADDAYPLSLSMPLAARDHSHKPIEAFIWNLLPDNERTLDRWARQFQVSARNPFALIGAVGEDCAGAVQFVRPERIGAIGDLAGDVRWQDESDIGARLRSVVDDAASGRTAGENGQFSLAGAQPKTTLLRDGDRWGVPSGRIPTTHILKPPARDLPGHAENEHFCLNLARAVGLRAARSTVRRFDGQLAIVIERYDRLQQGAGPGGLVRIHQEDTCQALGVLPWKKYQNEGGPTAAQIVRLLRDSIHDPGAMGDAADIVRRDVASFTDSLIFNWLIGGTDAHAKNYSLLLGGEGTVRLAPLYDIASAYGLADQQPQKMKMAMKIEYYLLERVTTRHWMRWAETTGIDPDEIAGRIMLMAADLPAHIAQVSHSMRGEGLTHAVIDRLEEVLTARARKIAEE